MSIIAVTFTITAKNKATKVFSKKFFCFLNHKRTERTLFCLVPSSFYKV